MRQSASIPESTLQRQYVWRLLVGYLVAACVCAISLAFEFRHIDEGVAMLARERGHVLFRLVELTRDWNAQHGGVYVPISEQDQPNPYLEHPRRDLVTTDGTRLTMVNPAYMTRQIAEIAEKEEGIRLHITSLNPIRPANAADAWESETLAMFETGQRAARLSLVETDGKAVHRYMEPLLIKEACLQCHVKQGYKLGQVRGGISITLPASEALQVRDRLRERALVVYVSAALCIALLIHFIVARSRRHVATLHRLAAGQERLIAERTRALSESNARLQGEVDERKRRENELQIAGAVMANAAEGIVVVDGRQRIIEVNPAFSALSGYRPSEVIGTEAASLAREGGDSAFMAALRDKIKQNGHWNGEMWCVRKSGIAFPVLVSIAMIDGAERGVGRYVATFSDITERKESEMLLQHRASSDPLTDLANRANFEDRLQYAVVHAGLQGANFALLYVDLDRFKEVNDKLGHAAGDELLVEVSRRLLVAVRDSDVVARLGGDEFAVIITRLTVPAQVEDVARRIVADLAMPYLLTQGVAEISASVGIAICPVHGDRAVDLKRHADTALYQAKNEGRNTFRVYSG